MTSETSPRPVASHAAATARPRSVSHAAFSAETGSPPEPAVAKLSRPQVCEPPRGALPTSPPGLVSCLKRDDGRSYFLGDVGAHLRPGARTSTRPHTHGARGKDRRMRLLCCGVLRCDVMEVVLLNVIG